MFRVRALIGRPTTRRSGLAYYRGPSLFARVLGVPDEEAAFRPLYLAR
ncbi:MAG: hypothetical protein AAF565_04810 [Pseudomonadota bacterium]